MKKLFLFILLFCTPILCLVGCSNDEDEKNRYEIVVDFDLESKTANCFEEITYVNNSNNAFDKLCFHLYPNAFREESEHKVVSKANIFKAYPNGESYGEIEVQSVEIEDNETAFSIAGDDENILEVPLKTKLYPNESVKIGIDFFLILPNINHRFGYGNNTINFGNFYPIACVYEDGIGFKTSPYSSNGDPFYSDVADYSVVIKHDKSLKLATTGKVTNQAESGEKITSTITQSSVRDFCFVLSSRFEVLEKQVEDVTVKYYYYNDEDPSISLECACQAITTFNNLFGRYPYSEFSVVESNFVHGGMEYPTLVLISDDIASHEEYEYVIVHETAHQWWYAAVGNDEYDEAWLDEGLTEYSTLLFYRENPQYGLDFDQLVKNANDCYKEFLGYAKKIYAAPDTSMIRGLDEFKTEQEYVNMIYVKSVMMLDTIEQQMETKKFLKCLQKYFETFKFKNASTEDLISCFEKTSSQKVEEIFLSWLNGRVTII